MPTNDEFLWRYLDLHKFYDLIFNKRIPFSRIDRFEDPLEGIPFEYLKHAQFHGTNWNGIIAHPKNYPFQMKLPIPSRLDQISSRQTCNYASCWFYSKNESMAIWNLYSNPESVAIKIPFGKIKEFIKPKYIDKKIKDFFCGKVQYQNLVNPESISELLEINSDILRKDLSFEHEKEIRFVVELKKATTEEYIYTEAIDLNEAKMKVICHPKMEAWKKTNIKNMLSNMKILDSYEDSRIVLRNF